MEGTWLGKRGAWKGGPQYSLVLLALDYSHILNEFTLIWATL